MQTLSMTQLHNQQGDVMAEPVRRLRCCCCGGAFQGRQFHNQDTGYGLGDCCVEYVTPRVEDVERTYGVSGVHYRIVESPLTRPSWSTDAGS